MSNGTSLEPAAVDHVTSTATGVIVGGLAAGAAVILAPVILPAIGLGALGVGAVSVISSIPWLGAAVGGWIGYNNAKGKARMYGIKAR